MRIEFVQHKDQSKLFLNSEVFKTEKQDLPSVTSHPVIRKIKKIIKPFIFLAHFPADDTVLNFFIIPTDTSF